MDGVDDVIVRTPHEDVGMSIVGTPGLVVESQTVLETESRIRALVEYVLLYAPKSTKTAASPPMSILAILSVSTKNWKTKVENWLELATLRGKISREQ